MTEEDRRYVRAAFTFWVRCGFHDEEEILSSLSARIDDLVGSSDTAFLSEIEHLVVEAFEAQRQLEASWPEETINDRIDEAFAELLDSGIIALQNAGYTVEQGWEDVVEARQDLESPRGAVFYCQQDTEAAVDGQGLPLTFGAFSGIASDSTALATEVCEVLRKNGVDVQWAGTYTHQIVIPPFLWRKRLG